jgi:hypothetical protein
VRVALGRGTRAAIAAGTAALSLAGAQGALGDGRAWLSGGGKGVELAWTGMRAEPSALTMSVTHDGTVTRFRGLQRGGWGVPAAGRIVVLRDLDRDAEPEAIADLTTGGERRRLRSHIVHWLPDERRHRRIIHDWGRAGYRTADLNRDRRPEFISADDRLRFGVPARALRMPIRIHAYRSGRMIEVTRAFPARVRADMAGHWRAIAALGRAGAPTRAAAAAYLADAHLLGVAKTARARLRARFTGPSDVRFLDTLDRRLAALGYPAADTVKEPA